MYCTFVKLSSFFEWVGGLGRGSEYQCINIDGVSLYICIYIIIVKEFLFICLAQLMESLEVKSLNIHQRWSEHNVNEIVKLKVSGS